MEKRKSRSNGGRRTVTPALAILRPEGTVAYIGGSDTLPAPLTREEEQALFLSMDEQPETARPDADRAQPAAGRLHRQKI